MDKKKITYIHLGILIIIIAINYFGSFFNHFTYDDRLILSENEYFQNLFNFNNLFNKDYFKFSGEATYRVVVTLSYMFDYKIWGLSSFGFHFTNLLLHLLVTIALYFLIRKIWYNIGARLPRPYINVEDSKIFDLPFIVALLFSSHPVHSEVINAVGFREDSLCALFYILSFFLFIKVFDNKSLNYTPQIPETPETSQHDRMLKFFFLFFIGAIIFYLLSLFSKEMGITLPIVLLLYYGISEKSRDAKFCISTNIRKCILYLIPFIVVTLFYVVIRFKILTVPPIEIAQYQGGSFVNNIFTMSKVFLYYVFLLFSPFKLKIQYEFPASTGFSDIVALISILVIIFIVILSVYLRRYSRIYTFSILFFFITLLPVSNAVPLINFIAERYLYLPSLGFCLLVSYLINKIKIVHIRYFIVIILLCLYFIVNIRQNKVWRDDLTLWEEAVKDAPHSFRVRYNLGSAYRLAKDYKLAMEEFREAIKLDPQNIETYSILAVTYADIGKIDEAKKILQEALKISPNESKIYINLANAFRVCKDYNTAIDLLNQAVELAPDNPQCYLKLGAIYGEIKDYQKAIKAFKKAVELDRNNPRSYYNLANALRLNGDMESSIEYYKKAMKLNPFDFNSHLNLGGIYFQKNMFEQAIEEFKEAKRIKPDFIELRYNLALAYMMLNKRENARRELEDILRINPDYEPALTQLKLME